MKIIGTTPLHLSRPKELEKGLWQDHLRIKGAKASVKIVYVILRIKTINKSI